MSCPSLFRLLKNEARNEATSRSRQAVQGGGIWGLFFFFSVLRVTVIRLVHASANVTDDFRTLPHCETKFAPLLQPLRASCPSLLAVAS